MFVPYNTSVEQIDLWRRCASEDQRLEFKEARLQFDSRRLCEYCVALANEGGGRLLLGIADKPPRPVVGTQAFRDTIGAAQRLFESVGFRVDIEEVAHPAGRILVFHIPARPVGTAYHFDGRYLMRSGEALVPMSEDRLRAVFAEGGPHWLHHAARRGVSADDICRMLEIRRYFERLNIPLPDSPDGIIDRLLREQIITRDVTGFAITRLGAILFGNHLRDFEDLRYKSSRIIVYDGPGKLSTLRELTMAKGYAASFDELIDLIELQTPVREVIERALRREERTYPSIAIRELVGNALIHQDFVMTGATVMIEIYDRRIEISNPGQPTVQPDRFIDEYRCRNEVLADFMRRLGICEEKGSGVDKVVRAAEQFHLPAPEFRVDSVRTTCILHGPRTFQEMSREDRIRACYQHCCLKYVTNERMSNQSLRERFGLPQAKSAIAFQMIRATQAVGKIKIDAGTKPSRRYARYVPFWA